jgi:hypothetical protein
MIRRIVQRAIQATRPPVPQRFVRIEEFPASPPDVAISIGRSLESAVRMLRIDLHQPVLLIPDHRPDGRPGPRVTDAVIRALAGSVPVTLGLPSNMSAAEIRRWTRLAESVRAAVVILGASGWARVSLGERSGILEDVDAPAELYGDAAVVAVSAPNGSGSVELWAAYAHPHTRLRAKVAEHGAIELAAAVNTRYLLIGQFGSLWLAAIASPAIVAEVLARGIERLRERSRGLEAPGPWEDSGVQHLAGLVPDGQEPYDLVLRTSLEDNADVSLAERLSELLGWPLSITSDEEGRRG